MFTRLHALIIAVALSFTLAAEASDVDTRQQKRLQTTVMNSNLPLEKRIEALKVLHADAFKDGKMKRSFVYGTFWVNLVLYMPPLLTNNLDLCIMA